MMGQMIPAGFQKKGPSPWSLRSALAAATKDERIGQPVE